MKSFNEWRERERFNIREGELVLEELNAPMPGNAPQPQVTGSGGTVGMSAGTAPRATPGAPSGVIGQEDITPFLRYITQIGGTDVVDPGLATALKQLVRKAPAETDSLLRGLLSMKQSQLNRLGTQYNKLAASGSGAVRGHEAESNTPPSNNYSAMPNAQPQVQR